MRTSTARVENPGKDELLVPSARKSHLVARPADQRKPYGWHPAAKAASSSSPGLSGAAWVGELETVPSHPLPL